jgi:hypothetical protein
VSLLAAGVLAAAGASPVRAVDGYTEVACPNLDNFFAGSVNGGTAYYYVDVLSSSRDFEPAFGEFLDNDTDSPRSQTITVSRQNTVTTRVMEVQESTSSNQGSIRAGFRFWIFGGVDAQASFTQTLRRTVSNEITQSSTTTLGVSTSFTVPPHTRVLSQRGFEVQDVTLQVQVVFRLNGQDGKCFKSGAEPDFQAVTRAPTINEGWRSTEAPYPTVTKMVDDGTAMPGGFSPGSQVEIQGKSFYPPKDEVRVTQGGTTWILKAGSFGWQDLETRIRATLPIGLQFGPAQIRVVSDGLVSAPYTIEIQSIPPRVNPGGVQNPRVAPGEPYTTDFITSGSLVAIFGSRFTAGADKVVVTQTGRQYTVQAGSPQWYDSPVQINATLPVELQPGPAEVRVVNATGVQSAPETITVVHPRAQIQQVVSPNVPPNQEWSGDRIQAGTMVSVFGQLFRPGEDRVVLAQNGVLRTIQAGSPHWYDGIPGTRWAYQINFLMPGDVQTGSAEVYVVHSRGASEPFPITIVDTAPRIDPGRVLNPNAPDPLGNWTQNNIRGGTMVAIFGDFFTPSPGDAVRVTQGGNSWTVRAGSPHWYDSTVQINVSLPTGLQPGQAQVQVINSNGRASAAETIPIVA